MSDAKADGVKFVLLVMGMSSAQKQRLAAKVRAEYPNDPNVRRMADLLQELAEPAEVDRGAVAR